jgi:hypothetical protein
MSVILPILIFYWPVWDVAFHCNCLDGQHPGVASSPWVDQVVDCGLGNAVPSFNGCAKLLDMGRNWNTLSYMVIQSIPNMLNGWHVWWACKLWNWDILSFQELYTDPCHMGLCIIMLKHMMASDEWHDNGLQDLVTVSLCIQMAIDMQLCALSVAYDCPYHQNLLAPHTTPYTLRCLPFTWHSWNGD